MPLPANRMIDWTKMLNKPDATDRVPAIYDIDADEQKSYEWQTFKTFFALRDENTDIDANYEFQTNKQLKFGAAGEFVMYHDATDMRLLGVTATGKLKLQLNSLDFMVLDPVNNSIKCGDRNFNNTGAVGLGIEFDATDRLKLMSAMLCYADIALYARNISYSGATNTGLEFDASNNATFKQNLIGDGTLSMTGNSSFSTASFSGDATLSTGSFSGKATFNSEAEFNGSMDVNCTITMGTNYINNTGAAATGLYFDASNLAVFTTLVWGQSGFKSMSHVDTPYLWIVENPGAPAAEANKIQIYGAGLYSIKAKFDDGTVKTFTLT